MQTYYEEVKHRGYVRGRNMAAAQEFPLIGSMQRWPDEIKDRKVESIDDQQELMTAWAYASEANDRCFSPFEFTASEFNNRDDAEECRDEFSAGIDEGIADELNSRFASKRERWYAAYAEIVVEEGDTNPPDPRVIASKHKLTEDETELLVELANDVCGCPTGRA